MARDLVSQGVETMLRAIAEGQFQPGVLPPEGELVDFLGCSRATVREVIRTLSDRGIVVVQHGRGTYLQPQDQWIDMRSLVEVALQSRTPKDVSRNLIEIRRMIEVGSCGHAAARATEENLQAMEVQLALYDDAAARNDAAACASADVAFHQEIFKATGNPFLLAIVQPLESAMRRSRELTSSVPEVRKRAQRHHREIFAALRAGDEEGAKNAMRSHMAQTRGDIEGYVQ